MHLHTLVSVLVRTSRCMHVRPRCRRCRNAEAANEVSQNAVGGVPHTALTPGIWSRGSKLVPGQARSLQQAEHPERVLFVRQNQRKRSEYRRQQRARLPFRRARHPRRHVPDRRADPFPQKPRLYRDFIQDVSGFDMPGGKRGSCADRTGLTPTFGSPVSCDDSWICEARRCEGRQKAWRRGLGQKSWDRLELGWRMDRSYRNDSRLETTMARDTLCATFSTVIVFAVQVQTLFGSRVVGRTRLLHVSTDSSAS